MADLSYCAAQVRDFDNDRFLTALFAPAELSEPLMTLYAFNLELSKIRETVSEPLIGRMRLQFWRDAVDGIVDGTPPAHEIAKALSQTVRAHNILKADLHTLIDAREIDLGRRAAGRHPRDRQLCRGHVSFSDCDGTAGSGRRSGDARRCRA